MKEGLIYHYGERLFKCRFMACSLRRHGFETRASRNSREKEHEKPWQCDVAGCEFENGGFLSRKMRDEHLQRFHTPQDVLPNGELENLDEADLRDICLDLVKADDVSGIRDIASAGMLNGKPYADDLITCAARYAPPNMMKILLGQKRHHVYDHVWNWDSPFKKLLLPQIVADKNSIMLEYILHTTDEDWNFLFKKGCYVAKCSGLPEILAKGNDEMLNILCKWVEQDVRSAEKSAYLVSPRMVAATAGNTYREQTLLELWRKVPPRRWGKNNWKNAILSVASTTFSIELAKFLIDQGVPADWRNSKGVPTPLVHAARQTTAEAAGLVRLLLYNGAEAVVEIVKGDGKEARREGTVQKSQIHVSELKGARQISKWLGVSFDELLAQAKKARGEAESSDS
jgi:hypothetical protein